MTPAERAAIQARADAATPGPWGTYHNVHGWHYTMPSGPVLRSSQQSQADVQFIAHAREDIPALLAEVQRLWIGGGAMPPAEIAALRARADAPRVKAGVFREAWRATRQRAEQTEAALAASEAARSRLVAMLSVYADGPALVEAALRDDDMMDDLQQAHQEIGHLNAALAEMQAANAQLARVVAAARALLALTEERGLRNMAAVDLQPALMRVWETLQALAALDAAAGEP